MRISGLLLALSAGCTGGGADKGPEGNESTADADPCDGTGAPAVQLGSVVDGGYAPWGPSIPYRLETGDNYVLDVGFAAANLELDGFATVRVVATQAGNPKFEADIPAGITCQTGIGHVGSMAIRWPWNTVDGQEILFEGTITDDAGNTATGSSSVTVVGG